MSYIKRIYSQILEQYPDKAKEIIADFQAWKEGEYNQPKTQELKDILEGYVS